MKWLIALLLLCLLAGCSNSANVNDNEMTQAIQNGSLSLSDHDYEEKAYSLSDINFHPSVADYKFGTIEDYFAKATGLVQATVGRIRENDGVYALDIKVTRIIKGTDQNYMQLIYTAALFPMQYEEGKEYLFSFHVADSLEFPEPLYIVGEALYYPIKGEARYLGEPIKVEQSLLLGRASKIGDFDKAAMKASGIVTLTTTAFEEIADFADIVAIVDIESVEEISPATSLAYGVCIDVLKGDVSGAIRIFVPTGTQLGEALISMTEIQDGEFYAVSSRTNAVLSMKAMDTVKTALESIRSVQDVSIDKANLIINDIDLALTQDYAHNTELDTIDAVVNADDSHAD